MTAELRPQRRQAAAASRSARPLISEVDRVVFTVDNLDRALEDYTEVFDCVVERRAGIDPATAALVGHPGAAGTRLLLRLGRQHVEFLQFDGRLGRPYPPDSTSSDLWFQHVALVVDDMAEAYHRVTASGRFRPISRRGPVRLPVRSGGVTAFKFRDRDGHPLELLAFPEGQRPDEWSQGAGSPFLGIDHTGISAIPSRANLRFFRAVLGLGLGARTENRGTEQADLDDLDDAYVTITRLAPDLAAPRLELLGYHNGLRRPIPRDAVAADLAVAHTVLTTRSLESVLSAAASARDATVVPPAPQAAVTLTGEYGSALLIGPDGHRFLIEERDPEAIPRAANSTPGPSCSP